MIFAATLSHYRSEQALLCLDAAVYVSLAVLLALRAVDDYAAATRWYLALAVAVNGSRHVAASRAACNQDATSEGHLRRLPAALTAAEIDARPATVLPWLPALVLALAAAGDAAPLALLAAEAHFIVTRVHGDCRGGKCAPTMATLLLHVVAQWAGAPPAAALSLHRLLIVWTYFLTGLRKLYCVGPRWCDGYNLQLMCGIQGLYHDAPRGGWNALLAGRRRLCCVGSVGVVGMQLALPALVYSPAGRALAFAAAMGFHASNLVLWRINFFVG